MIRYANSPYGRRRVIKCTCRTARVNITFGDSEQRIRFQAGLRVNNKNALRVQNWFQLKNKSRAWLKLNVGLIDDVRWQQEPFSLSIFEPGDVSAGPPPRCRRGPERAHEPKIKVRQFGKSVLRGTSLIVMEACILMRNRARRPAAAIDSVTRLGNAVFMADARPYRYWIQTDRRAAVTRSPLSTWKNVFKADRRLRRRRRTGPTESTSLVYFLCSTYAVWFGYRL